MSQHDYVIDNASGATVRADINSALSAIQSLNSGTSAPSSTAAGMLWLDTTGGAPYALKVRDAGNNHWLTLGNVTDPGADGNLELLPGKINLPSSGGIYESDGSTEILTESSGTVSLKNTSINANNVFPSGHIIQVVSNPNSYPHTLSGLSGRSNYLAIQSASSTDWELTLSNVAQGNKILLTGMVHFSVDTTNGNPAYKLQMKVDSDAYADLALGDSSGSRTRQFGGTRAVDIYSISSASINLLCSPSISGSTGTIKFKIMCSQGAGTARDVLINFTGVNSAEGYTAVSVLTGMEIQQ